MTSSILRAAIAVSLAATGATALANPSIPSVIVTVENSAPSRGAAQTPFWVGIHDGSFDIYDRNVPLGAEGLVPAPAVERLAEDGATGPISDEFSISQNGAPQATLFGPTGPFAPGDRSARTLQVNPETDRYFSYASMVIPSNDAFIANGNPLAHPLFDDQGNFVAETFAVTGTEVLDAGTEVNDEFAPNTAFLAQAAPDTSVIENGTVVLHEGFRLDGAFPNGVLTHPIFGLADFTSPEYRAATFSFRYVDLGRTNIFQSALLPGNEVSADIVQSNGFGRATATTRNGNEVRINVRFRGTTGDVTMAHLHLGQAGTNGPVVANLTPSLRGDGLRAVITTNEVTGPLAEGGNPILNLLNEMAAGNVYVNLHTAQNPAGELRGQLNLIRGF